MFLVSCFLYVHRSYFVRSIAFGVRNLFTNDIMSTKFDNIFARHLFFRYGINVEDFRPYYSLGSLKSVFTVAINEADMFCEAEIKASEMFASHQRSNSCCDMDVEVNDQILEIDESLILDKTLVNPPSTHATLVNLDLCSTDQAVVKPGTSTCVDVHSEYHSILTQCKEVCTQPFVDKFDPNPRIVRQLALEFGSITTDGIRYRFYRAMAVGFDIFVQAHKLDRDMALRFVANDWVAYKHSFKVSSFLAGK
ncbi:hypothetical protein LSTR_LSTR007646 [Laodelphax striatellus]|uniref:Uncharacterized protein n=1 Tax=Laodelphax striatellus TaxID=195883 RepID=A0A482WJD3_LAOST|nr:hypothetical protein LSTR_LSTR007646 [Laodelphax striatellus]